MAGRTVMNLGLGKRRKSRIDAAIDRSVRGKEINRNAKGGKPVKRTQK